jgi:hypothetical protein
VEAKQLKALPEAKRRRLIIRALIRSAAAGAVLVVLYYLLPLDHLSEVGSVLAVIGGLIGVAVIMAWQARAIAGADYPGIRTIGALAMIGPLFLLLFASVYYLLEHEAPGDFSQHLTRTDALYFTVVTFGTVGYGDITAKSEGARLLVTLQILADLVFLGFGVKVLFEAARLGRQRSLEIDIDPPDESAQDAVGPTPPGN